MRVPSIPTFLKALRKFFQRPELTPKRIELKRDEICRPCFFNDHGQCQKCTCYTPLKTKFSTERCPIGKWEEYFNPIKNGL